MGAWTISVSAQSFTLYTFKTGIIFVFYILKEPALSSQDELTVCEEATTAKKQQTEANLRKKRSLWRQHKTQWYLYHP